MHTVGSKYLILCIVCIICADLYFLINNTLISLLEDNLANMITYCESLLSSTKPTRSHVKWKERMIAAKEKWTHSRESIFDVVVSQEGFPVEQCKFCEKRKPFVRCHQCGLSFYQCEICDEEIHSNNPFHDREVWNGNFFEAVSPMEKSDGQGNIINGGKIQPMAKSRLFRVSPFKNGKAHFKCQTNQNCAMNSFGKPVVCFSC